jgi:hypothetical protein
MEPTRMSAPHTVEAPSSDQIEFFIERFFGPGNTVWSDHITEPPWLTELLAALRQPTWAPVVLPRTYPDDGRRSFYVLAWGPSHATNVSEMLMAFLGHSYTSFDGRPARLDPSDPVEQALLDFTTLSTVFKLTNSHQTGHANTWRELRRMQKVASRRPHRDWHVYKPVGRLLAEFSVALAAGEVSASADLLDQLAAAGNLSGQNIAYLRLGRLARLGRHAELLGLLDLADIAASNPPIPVKDAILTALFNTYLEEPLTAGDLSAARELLIEHGQPVPKLLRGRLDCLGAPALAVATLAASVLQNESVLQQILDDPPSLNLVQNLTPALAATVQQAHAAQHSPGITTGPAPILSSLDNGDIEESGAELASWAELIDAIAAGLSSATTCLNNAAWFAWEPPATCDTELADRLAALTDEGAERIWSIVGPFIEADSCLAPAAQTARELVRNALIYNRFTPGDLAGIVALAEIVLRAAPNRRDYVALVDELRDETTRWVRPDHANVALDLADLLVRAACPDQEARARLAEALLVPLHTQAHRLEPDQLAFARQLSDELALELPWPDDEVDDTSSGATGTLPGLTVLLYSLDQGALARASAALERFTSRLKIHQSHDYVGSPQLKSRTRSADVVVIATRCAKHAATGFIRANTKRGTVIVEADGAGSASLLRAAFQGVHSATGQQ